MPSARKETSAAAISSQAQWSADRCSSCGVFVVGILTCEIHQTSGNMPAAITPHPSIVRCSSAGEPVCTSLHKTVGWCKRRPGRVWKLWLLDLLCCRRTPLSLSLEWWCAVIKQAGQCQASWATDSETQLLLCHLNRCTGALFCKPCSCEQSLLTTCTDRNQPWFCAIPCYEGMTISIMRGTFSDLALLAADGTAWVIQGRRFSHELSILQSTYSRT